MRTKGKKAKKFSLGFWVLAFSCLMLLVSCQSTKVATGSMVKVERVVNGQSLEVTDSNTQPGSILRVRLIGIDTPDFKQQPWGPAAQDRLEQLIAGKPVLLESDEEKEDKYQRRLAYVWGDRELLNERLIAEGYALFVPRSPNNKYDSRLARAQEFARIMGLGIWDSSQPMRLTPAEFRHQYR